MRGLASQTARHRYQGYQASFHLASAHRHSAKLKRHGIPGFPSRQDHERLPL